MTRIPSNAMNCVLFSEICSVNLHPYLIFLCALGFHESKSTKLQSSHQSFTYNSKIPNPLKALPPTQKPPFRFPAPPHYVLTRETLMATMRPGPIRPALTKTSAKAGSSRRESAQGISVSELRASEIQWLHSRSRAKLPCRCLRALVDRRHRRASRHHALQWLCGRRW